jgi:hypothetical protein
MRESGGLVAERGWRRSPNDRSTRRILCAFDNIQGPVRYCRGFSLARDGGRISSLASARDTPKNAPPRT